VRLALRIDRWSVLVCWLRQDRLVAAAHRPRAGLAVGAHWPRARPAGRARREPRLTLLESGHSAGPQQIPRRHSHVALMHRRAVCDRSCAEQRSPPRPSHGFAP